jgi:hypothetical protein
MKMAKVFQAEIRKEKEKKRGDFISVEKPLKALSVVTHYCLIQSSRRQVFFFIAANEEQENDAPRSILIMIFEICSAVQFRNFFISIKCEFLACFVLFFIERLKHVPYLTRLQF